MISINEEFQKYLHRFQRDKNDRDATRFLFRLFNLWLTYFLRDYRERWGKNALDREDEKDLRQDILIKFFEVIKTRRFEYKQARSYLFIIFKTKCIDRIRGKNQQFLRFEEEVDARMPIIPLFDESSILDDMELYELIEPYWKKALDKSYESTKIIIKLLKQNALSEEICRRLGIPNCSPSIFNQRVYRAKKSFQESLLRVLLEAISNENLNSVDREIIKGLCERMKKN